MYKKTSPKVLLNKDNIGYQASQHTSCTYNWYQ